MKNKRKTFPIKTKFKMTNTNLIQRILFNAQNAINEVGSELMEEITEEIIEKITEKEDLEKLWDLVWSISNVWDRDIDFDDEDLDEDDEDYEDICTERRSEWVQNEVEECEEEIIELFKKYNIELSV